jgi:hypothetical protein
LAGHCPAQTEQWQKHPSNLFRHPGVADTLATLPGTVSSGDIKPPTLLVIGHVVGLHSDLAWYNPDDCNPDTDTETNLHAKSDFSR